FPHHRDGLLKLLRCDYHRAAVGDALRGWRAEALEQAAAEAGLAVAACRSFAEWDAHPQARPISRLPLFSIAGTGEAPPQPLPAGERPLSGIRVLDLTRVIAGPVGGRTLAVHGADVLLVTASHLPATEVFVIDSGRGKLSTSIDLRAASGCEALTHLLSEADVFVQSYRPGAIAEHGFGPQAAARIRPGLIYVSLCAYGHEGPWAARDGYDSLVQTASGFNDAEAQWFAAPEPHGLPSQAQDHGRGCLGACAAMTALARRVREGGTWHARVSLAQTGYWLRGLGRIDGMGCPDPSFDDVQDRLEDSASGFGRLTAVRHSAVMSETPPQWARPSVPLGTHPPAWPASTPASHPP